MNERALYKRDCDLCGKNVVMMYPKDKNLKVYCMPCWWSDKWDPLTYGIEGFVHIPSIYITVSF